MYVYNASAGVSKRCGWASYYTAKDHTLICLVFFAYSSSGRTSDSESENLGSIPSWAANLRMVTVGDVIIQKRGFGGCSLY